MSKILFRLKSDLENNFYPPLTLSSHSTYAVTSLIWESAAKPSSCHPSLPPVRSPCDAKSHLGEKRKGSDTCLPDLHRRRQHQRRPDTWTPTYRTVQRLPTHHHSMHTHLPATSSSPFDLHTGLLRNHLMFLERSFSSDKHGGKFNRV